MIKVSPGMRSGGKKKRYGIYATLFSIYDTHTHTHMLRMQEKEKKPQGLDRDNGARAMIS